MGEKRRHRRVKKRLRVNYGERDLSRTAFTGDLSEGGLFVVSNTLEPLDTRLHLQLIMDSEQVAYFEGVVTWHKNVPPELRSTDLRRGFGVRFLPPREVVAAALGKTEGPLVVRYPTLEVLKLAYASELKLGGAFVPTPRSFSRDEEVMVLVELEFAGKHFEFTASVLQVIDGAGGRRGVALSFREPAQVRDALLPLMASAS